MHLCNVCKWQSLFVNISIATKNKVNGTCYLLLRSGCFYLLDGLTALKDQILRVFMLITSRFTEDTG